MGRTVLTEAEQQQAEAVFQEHRTFVESVARKHSPNLQDVPDIVQTVGMKVCRSIHGFQGRAKLQSWLYRITVNVARDLHRRESRQVRIVERLDMLDPQTEAVHTDDPVVQTDRQKAVHDAIQKLRIRNNLGQFTNFKYVAANMMHGDGRTTKKKARQRQQQVIEELRAILASDPRITGGSN